VWVLSANICRFIKVVGGVAMPEQRSFKEYVAIRFYNELFAAISEFLEQNHDGLDVSSNSVRTIDSVELSDITVKQVYVDNLPNMKIAFEVLV
jgi:aromatic ring-cleaving dioxygenase